MLLFPGEEEYLESIGHDFMIKNTNIKSGEENIRILSCNGSCARKTRPLACRIFPLFPFYRNGRVTVEFDPRAIGKCPLFYKDIEGIYISGLFRLRILEAGYILSQNERTKIFLEILTAELDQINRFKS
jgi:hypothetical protein